MPNTSAYQRRRPFAVVVCLSGRVHRGATGDEFAHAADASTRHRRGFGVLFRVIRLTTIR